MKESCGHRASPRLGQGPKQVFLGLVFLHLLVRRHEKVDHHHFVLNVLGR